jgi:hypothetical protein
MGDLATPTPADRASLRALAVALLESVRSDSSPPAEILAQYGDWMSFAVAVGQECEALCCELCGVISRTAGGGE